MKLLNTNTYTISKSKFITYYYLIDNLEEINTILTNLKKEHKKATHFPYAYIYNNQMKKSEDKEPINTSGTQILNTLIKNNLNNHLIIIVRYFGGTKLGSGPLLRTYLMCANNIIKNTK